MTAIDERHIEWATVERMRAMLRSTRRDYEITQTYTLFTSILCWTLQRIRWKEDDTKLAEPMAHLRAELERNSMQDFLRGIPLDRPKIVKENSLRKHETYFNDFSKFEIPERDKSSLTLLVDLRNAVAHGDLRKIKPISRGPRLLGYEINCESRGRDWKAEVSLNRAGMSYVADKIAELFCNAAIDQHDAASLRDAESIREAAG